MDDSRIDLVCKVTDLEVGEDRSRFGYHVVNQKTGKYFPVSNEEKMMRTLRQRIFSFAEVTSKAKKYLGDNYILIQLSYRDNRDWKSKQMTRFIRSAVDYLGKDSVYDYAWVLEIKPIGRNLHYHLALHVEEGSYLPFPDKTGMWGYGSTNIYGGKSSPYYLAKYVTKKAQKLMSEYPMGARKYSTWLSRKYYSDGQVLAHRKTAYPGYVWEKVEELGITRFSVRRSEPGSDEVGWIITVLDKMHSLEGLEIVVKSPWVMCRSLEEVKRWFPDASPLIPVK